MLKGLGLGRLRTAALGDILLCFLSAVCRTPCILYARPVPYHWATPSHRVYLLLPVGQLTSLPLSCGWIMFPTQQLLLVVVCGFAEISLLTPALILVVESSLKDVLIDVEFSHCKGQVRTWHSSSNRFLCVRLPAWEQSPFGTALLLSKLFF